MSSRFSTSSAEVMDSGVFVKSSNLLYNQGDLQATNLVVIIQSTLETHSKMVAKRLPTSSDLVDDQLSGSPRQRISRVYALHACRRLTIRKNERVSLKITIAYQEIHGNGQSASNTSSQSLRSTMDKIGVWQRDFYAKAMNGFIEALSKDLY